MSTRVSLSRVAAVVVLTAAFAPAAVMGALPLVAPVVGVLLLLFLLLVSAREPATIQQVTPAAAVSEPAEL
ncbi:MAG: hypothetical protein ACXV2J_06560 [Actinomycetes bacterium]